MLDPQSPVPLYYQLKQRLIREIGEWSAHAAIPPERDLIEQHGVSRTTVRQAIGELVTEGFLYRRHGKGTFVAPRDRISITLSELTGHVEELARRGLHPETRCLLRTTVPAPEAAADGLHLTVGAAVLRVDRLVSVDSDPLALIETYVPLELAGRLPERLDSLLVALESLGVLPLHGRQHITAVQAGRPESRQLGVAEGTPLLQVVRTVYAAGERPVEWSRATYRADRYEYVVQLRRRR